MSTAPLCNRERYSADMTESGETLTITATDIGFAVSGEIDAHTAPRVAAALADTPLDRIVVDMSGVEFVDSSGLRVLIEAHQATDRRGAALVLAEPSDAVVRLLQISGVDDYLNVEPA